MTDKTVPVWVDNDGQKVQVGWATPDDGTGVRKINLLDGFDNAAIKNAKFGDIDPFTTDLDPAETQEPPRTFEEFASEPFVSVEGEVLEPALSEADDFDPSGVTVVTQDPEVVLPSEPIEDAPDEEAAAEPVDAGVAPEESENDVLLDDEGFETWTQEDADALDDTDEDLPYIHDEDLENVDDDDSDETEDLPEGFEPAPAVQEEPTQDEDPAQP